MLGEFQCGPAAPWRPETPGAGGHGPGKSSCPAVCTHPAPRPLTPTRHHRHHHHHHSSTTCAMQACAPLFPRASGERPGSNARDPDLRGLRPRVHTKVSPCPCLPPCPHPLSSFDSPFEPSLLLSYPPALPLHRICSLPRSAYACEDGHTDNWNAEWSRVGATYPGLVKQDGSCDGNCDTKAKCSAICSAAGATYFNWYQSSAAIGRHGCRCYNDVQYRRITLTGAAASGWSFCNIQSGQPLCLPLLLHNLSSGGRHRNF